MPNWFARSTFGFVVAALYLAAAIYAVADSRKHQPGGWISLNGLAANIATLPAMALGNLLGLKPDFRRNVDMAIAIGFCAMLAYFAGAGLERVARFLFADQGSG